MLPGASYHRQRRRQLRPFLLFVLVTIACIGGVGIITIGQPVARWKVILHGKRPFMTGGKQKGPLPEYKDIIAYEAQLPQHNMDLPFPEGRHGRYVKFSNQPEKVGWNNVFNELLLGTHLAWRAKRAYVFQDFGWPPDHFPWPTLRWPIHWMPMNALVSGPTAGGSWEKGDTSPRSVSSKWFDVVCPPQDTEVIISDTAKDPVRGKDAKVILEYWVDLLNKVEKRCVDVRPGGRDGFPQTFDLWTISTSLVLPLWPEFRDSPTSRLLRTSPLIDSTIHQNEGLLFDPSNIRDPARYDTVMAVHLRRGDYEEACTLLAKHNSTFYMWNLLPELPDPLIATPPPYSPLKEGKREEWENTPENVAMVRKRCWPTEAEIVAKVMQAKSDWEGSKDSQGDKLRVLYVMTNGEEAWLASLKGRLKAWGWERVVAARELELSPEQVGVAMGVDMDIGRKAAVFIGNGWSSLSSNVVHRRLVDGHPASSIRFW